MLDFINAAEKGGLEKVRLLIENGEVTTKEVADIIDLAVRNNYIEIIKLLIDCEKVTIEAADNALEWSAIYGRKKIIELLIEHKKFTIQGADESISLAAKHGHKGIVKLWIDHNKVTQDGANDGIASAAISDHIETVELLINHEKVTKRGTYNAIKWAATYNRLEIVEMLLSYGVDFNTKGSSIRDHIQKLFTQIAKNQEIISPLLEKGFTDVKDFTDEQKEALSHKISLVHIIARYFNPKIYNNSTEQHKEAKKKILLNLAIANPHIQFNEILTSNPHLIKFLSIYARDNECSHKSEVIEMLFNTASCIIQDNLSIIGKSEERIKELNQKPYKNLDYGERKKLYYFEGLKELNNRLEEDKKYLKNSEVVSFREKLKERNKFSDIEIITFKERIIDQIYEPNEKKDSSSSCSKRLNINSGSSSRNR